MTARLPGRSIALGPQGSLKSSYKALLSPYKALLKALTRLFKRFLQGSLKRLLQGTKALLEPLGPRAPREATILAGRGSAPHQPPHKFPCWPSAFGGLRNLQETNETCYVAPAVGIELQVA